MSAIYRSAAGGQAVERRYRELLDQWPVPCRHLTVPTGQGDTFVVASGPEDAPAVLALQGSGANTAMWLREIETLTRDLRVYAVDVIGEPGLSAPSRPPLASDAHARWLDDVMAGLGLTEASLLGVSLGGWLALDYTIRRPERVCRLALLNPSGVGRRKIGVLLTAIALAPFGDWGRRRTMAMAVGAGARSASASATAEFALLIFKHFRPRMDRIPTFDDVALGRLRAPVLAVLGGRDTMLDAQQTKRRLEAGVPHADVRFLPAAGHVLPDQAATVVDFLTAPPVKGDGRPASGGISPAPGSVGARARRGRRSRTAS